MLMGSQEEGLSHDCGRGEPGPVKLALGASAVTSQQQGGSRSSGPPMLRQGGFLLLLHPVRQARRAAGRRRTGFSSPSGQCDPSHCTAFLSWREEGGHELHSLLEKDCFHMDSAGRAQPRVHTPSTVLMVGLCPLRHSYKAHCSPQALPVADGSAQVSAVWLYRGERKPTKPHHSKSDSSSPLRGGMHCWSAACSC